MFTKADILARLQNGETADTIAAEMAAVLNEAEAEKRALAAETEKKAKEEATRIMNAKRVAVDGMLDCLCDFLVAAGEEKLIEDLKNIDTDEVVEMLDSMVSLTKSLEAFKGLQFPFADPCKATTINPKVHKIAVDADADDADKVIRDFLKTLSL